jgi:hypothetical protein
MPAYQFVPVLCCAIANVLMCADYNPSDTDDCVAYTQKRIFAFRQVRLADHPVGCTAAQAGHTRPCAPARRPSACRHRGSRCRQQCWVQAAPWWRHGLQLPVWLELATAVMS